MKHIITATVELEITAEVEAESNYEVSELMYSADWCIDTTDENITIKDYNHRCTDIDSVEIPFQKKWDEMDEFGRMELLKETGEFDGSTALEIADKDYGDLNRSVIDVLAE